MARTTTTRTLATYLADSPAPTDGYSATAAVTASGLNRSAMRLAKLASKTPVGPGATHVWWPVSEGTFDQVSAALATQLDLRSDFTQFRAKGLWARLDAKALLAAVDAKAARAKASRKAQELSGARSIATAVVAALPAPAPAPQAALADELQGADLSVQIDLCYAAKLQGMSWKTLDAITRQHRGLQAAVWRRWTAGPGHKARKAA